MGTEDPDKWISEVAKAWSSSGLLGKLLMILACIGASTTLTNLSDIFIEWRGLIAEMLSFYSQYVRDPIAGLVHLVTFGFLRPVGAMIDALLLYLIYFSAEKRVVGNLGERSALAASLFIMNVVVLPVILLSLLLGALLLLDRFFAPGVWDYANVIAVSLPLFFICWSLYRWIRSLIWLAKGSCPEGLVPESNPLLYKHEIAKFIQFATPMIVAFVVLALLASINLSLI